MGPLMQGAHRLVDLSHPIRHGMVTYPGLPGPTISTFVDRDESRRRLQGGAAFHIGRIDLVGNTGTYLDTPFHFHPAGPDTATSDITQMFDRECVVVDANDHDGIGPELLPPARVLAGAAVLFRTGRSSLFGQPEYAEGSPYLTQAAVEALVDARPALVGIDAINVDDIEDLSRPAHRLLLGAGIFIVEHLTRLHLVPDRGARFTAVPPPVVGAGTMPVRALAVIP